MLPGEKRKPGNRENNLNLESGKLGNRETKAKAGEQREPGILEKRTKQGTWGSARSQPINQSTNTGHSLAEPTPRSSGCPMGLSLFHLGSGLSITS